VRGTKVGFSSTPICTQAKPPPLRTRHPLVTTQNIYFLARMEAGVRWERGRTGLCRPGADTPPASSPPPLPSPPNVHDRACRRRLHTDRRRLLCMESPGRAPPHRWRGRAGACAWRRETSPMAHSHPPPRSLSLFSRSPSPRRGGYPCIHDGRPAARWVTVHVLLGAESRAVKSWCVWGGCGAGGRRPKGDSPRGGEASYMCVSPRHPRRRLKKSPPTSFPTRRRHSYSI
jgi:hypothetical protein